MDLKTLIIFLAIGAVAGWLAGTLMRGGAASASSATLSSVSSAPLSAASSLACSASPRGV